jgi:uncharacterized protein (DUF111 family)
MLLGALLDAGAGLAAVRASLAALHLPGWELETATVRLPGVAGTSARVRASAEHDPARRLADVEALLAAAALPARVRAAALATYRRVFAVEAEVHGVPAERVHLHELGRAAAVLAVVGACAAVADLAPARVTCGPVAVGRGTVRTAHGVLPVPAPAVARLLAGVPVAESAGEGEMATPTGVALLLTLADGFGDPPAGRAVRTGIGVGTRLFAGIPGSLRVTLVEGSAIAYRTT